MGGRASRAQLPEPKLSLWLRLPKSAFPENISSGVGTRTYADRITGFITVLNKFLMSVGFPKT